VEFRILGPLEVLGESGKVALGGIKPRAVLAVLLLHPNEAVNAERLALALWGEDAPASAVKTVQVYVSRLRKALGDVDALATTTAGYCLRVRADELDAERFARLVEDGRRALDAGRAEHAAAVLREALALWRGPPLAELAFEPFAQGEIARLNEQRLAALEARVEADLAAGCHSQLVGELRQLVAANPTRERLVGQLMLALYRCGQQVDALEAFHAARRVLVAQVGVEPGPELRRLEQAILRHEASLEPHAEVSELPQELDTATAPPLVGRDIELAWLRERWERARTCPGALLTLIGARGIGKSRLAAELAGEAHRLGADVLYCCCGRGPPDAVRAAIGRAGEASRATLLVVDDADEIGAEALAELEQLTRALADVPVLALALAQDAESLAGIDGDGALALQTLDAQAVRAIAVLYAPERVDRDVPADWLLESSGGVPRRVHEAASQWARSEAARQVSAVAGRTAASRAQLRSVESELTGNVVKLQAASERLALHGVGELPVICPFKGLASFEVADAPYFFGRERLVAELVARLVGAPLLGVVGPSGSGKSSVLRAGLLPALAGGVLPGSEHWPQIVIRPGDRPLRELSDAAADLDGDRRFVLAVDQFEETFTACRDEQERSAFIAELAQMSRVGDGAGIVVLAVRADYYGRCAAYPHLSNLLATNHVLVGPMRRDELRRAVEWPARRVGLRVEPELVDALVADVEHEVGGLPLLSTALLELWQQRDGRRLRHAAYEHSGAVRGAVARLAEDAFSQLDDARQIVARTVVMPLVGLGADGAVERRRVPLAQFATEQSEDVARVLALFTDRRLLTVSAGTVEVAHEALLREWPRLRGWIEEDREGLRIQRNLTSAVQEWDRLDRDEGALYRGVRLTETMQWRARRDGPLSEPEQEFLLASEASGVRERATRRRRMRLTAAALATLAAAVVAIIVAVLFAGRERDLAASRDLATKSLSLIATDPGLALAIAFEALRRSDTEQAQNAARQATLAHRATRVIAAHKGLAFGVSPSPDGRLVATAGGDRTVRIWSVSSGRRVAEIRGYRDEVRAVSFSRDGRRIASAAHDGEIAVASVSGARRKVIVRLLRGDHATSIDFGADGRTLAIGTYGGRVALIRLSDGAVRDLSQGSAAAPIIAVGFDRNARSVVSAGADGFARIWEVSGGRPLELPHPGKNPIVSAASFSPDGARVATADFSGAVRLWDAGNGRRVMRIQISEQPLVSMRFSGDGRRIVTAAFDGVVRVISVRERAVLAELKGHHGPAHADFVPGSDTLVSVGEEDGTLRTWSAPATRIATRPGRVPRFSRDGGLVVSGDDAGPIHLWNPATGDDRELAGHKEVSYPQFSPDGTQIVSASHDETVRLWDVKTGRYRGVPALAGSKFATAIDASRQRIAIGGATPLVIQAPDGSARLRLRGHRGYVNSLVFSPDSEHLLTGSDDGTARVWSARSGALQRTLRGHDGIVRGVSYSADGESIATAGSDGTVRVWPANGGDAVILVGHQGPVNTASFDGRGDRLVSAGDDGTIRVWNAAGGDALAVLYRHEGIASGADFSGDGRAVVSAGDDGMRVTSCEVCGTIEDALRVSRTRAQHTLSAAERQRLLPGG
jgi:WD40 repeat protein/DNA-binding SARP family transcriptional activator/energy-coupling factor transporter ATP-binding protein EcfA2